MMLQCIVRIERVKLFYTSLNSHNGAGWVKTDVTMRLFKMAWRFSRDKGQHGAHERQPGIYEGQHGAAPCLMKY